MHRSAEFACVESLRPRAPFERHRKLDHGQAIGFRDNAEQSIESRLHFAPEPSLDWLH
jgi:hypothetical protein